MTSDLFEPDSRFDEIVIGGGIAGLATALLLVRRGRRVAVLEAREIGVGATALSTGKVSALQGARLTEVADRNTPGVVRAYAESQIAAVEWIRAFTDGTAVAHASDAISFAIGERGAERIRGEVELGRSFGMPLEALDDLDLPIRATAAARLRDQLAVDPRALLEALAAAIRAEGGLIIENSRVRAVRATSPAEVRTASGSVFATHVIVATGAPILDRALYFAKLAAKRSYLMTSTIDASGLPSAMYLGIDSPVRSVREADGLLMTGGAGHGVGRESSSEAATRLRDATRAVWPDAEENELWSAQDYETPHRVPFVGWLPRGRQRIYLATGFGKWGLTNGVSSAMTLVADLLGDPAPWQRVLHRRMTLPRAIAAGFGENLAVGAWYARGWVGAFRGAVPDAVPEGDGAVGHRGFVPVAVSNVEGTRRELCAVCPHLGAIVGWNELEHTWDCPAHGSRFTVEGQNIEGPALRPMRTVGPSNG